MEIESLPVRSINNANVVANWQAVGAHQFGLFRGLSCLEKNGAAARFIVRNGTLESNPAIFHVVLAANESKTAGPWLNGVESPDGIFIDWISGAVDLTVFYSGPGQ